MFRPPGETGQPRAAVNPRSQGASHAERETALPERQRPWTFLKSGRSGALCWIDEAVAPSAGGGEPGAGAPGGCNARWRGNRAPEAFEPGGRGARINGAAIGRTVLAEI